VAGGEVRSQESGVRSQNAEYRKLESKNDEGFRGGKTMKQGVRGGPRTQEKECLFLTNKAVMLLKLKDRKNEQSRTKPIFEWVKRSAVEGEHVGRFHSPSSLRPEQMPTVNRGEYSSWPPIPDYGSNGVSGSSHKSLREIADPTGRGSAPANKTHRGGKFTKEKIVYF
jgi:hypothetical protein